MHSVKELNVKHLLAATFGCASGVLWAGFYPSPIPVHSPQVQSDPRAASKPRDASLVGSKLDDHSVTASLLHWFAGDKISPANPLLNQFVLSLSNTFKEVNVPPCATYLESDALDVFEAPETELDKNSKLTLAAKILSQHPTLLVKPFLRLSTHDQQERLRSLRRSSFVVGYPWQFAEFLSCIPKSSIDIPETMEGSIAMIIERDPAKATAFLKKTDWNSDLQVFTAWGRSLGFSGVAEAWLRSGQVPPDRLAQTIERLPSDITDEEIRTLTIAGSGENRQQVEDMLWNRKAMISPNAIVDAIHIGNVKNIPPTAVLSAITMLADTQGAEGAKTAYEAADKLPGSLRDNAYKALTSLLSHQLPDESNLADVQNWLNSPAAPSEPEAEKVRRNGITNICSSLVQLGNNPERASNFLASITDAPARVNGYESLANTWAQADTGAAGDWINTIPQGAERDHAILGLVANLVDSPAEAEAWINAIKQPELRAQAASKFPGYSAPNVP